MGAVTVSSVQGKLLCVSWAERWRITTQVTKIAGGADESDSLYTEWARECKSLRGCVTSMKLLSSVIRAQLMYNVINIASEFDWFLILPCNQEPNSPSNGRPLRPSTTALSPSNLTSGPLAFCWLRLSAMDAHPTQVSGSLISTLI